MKALRTLLALVALVCAWTPAAALPALWVAHGRHATIYLFGSVHLLPKGLDWRPPGLSDAISRADEIWFELPIDEATDLAAAKLSLDHGYLAPGDTLAKHLTADQDARLRRVCVKLGLSIDAVEVLRPWLAEVSLTLRADEAVGATAADGVERQLQGLAPAAARRRAFETPRQQIEFLADASLADQIASLDESLHEIEDDPGAYRRVLDSWMAGNVGQIEAEALVPLRKASLELYRRLISERNARWARAVARRAQGRGVVLIVVGAAHLAGPDGVPALLRASGIRVDGP